MGTKRPHPGPEKEAKPISKISTRVLANPGVTPARENIAHQQLVQMLYSLDANLSLTNTSPIVCPTLTNAISLTFCLNVPGAYWLR
mmetsp:Transcript_132480/g.424027  ORF Transcript_132480/g.424027 Transcript_132480/m.424027 type:complete len:86 (+) Transcript_132480:839-1096(+)